MKHRSNYTRHRKPIHGFTLIELLVVIAIIALLISVIVPSLRKVKEQAKKIICRTNLKSMQLATILYTDANEGKMPEYQFASGLWVNKLTAYLDDIDEARYCPSTKKRDNINSFSSYSWGTSKRTWVWYWDGMDTPEEGSYTINWWFYSNRDENDDRYYRKLDNVVMTSNTPVFADAIWVDCNPLDTDICPDDFDLNGDNLNGGAMSRVLTNRHGDEGNVGFVDGSQRPVELSAMWSLKWNKDFQTTPEKFRSPSGDPIYQVSR